MSRWLKLLEAAKDLNFDSPEAQIVFEALDTVLVLEGPPPVPVPNLSEDYREGYVRTKKSCTIRSFASSWITGPWRCLVLETHSIAMGRPITLSKKNGEEDVKRRSHTITDSRSERFMDRIDTACRSLGVAEPIGEGAVHGFCGSKWSFLAWRPRDEDESYDRTLRGDVDNYAKCYLDALQRARILTNDRGVIRLTISKEVPDAWLEPPRNLWERITESANALKDKGHDFTEIKAELALTHAQMEELFENYHAPARASRRGKRKPKPVLAVDPKVISDAVESISRKKAPLTYATALKALPGPPNSPAKAAFRSSVGELLAKRVLDSKFDSSAPVPFGMNKRTLRRLLQDHPKALKVLGSAEVKTGGRQALGGLDRAMDRIKTGEDFNQVVSEENVNANSLRSRLRRETKPKRRSK